MTRIGFYANTEGYGGSEVYLKSLIRGLKDKPYEIFLFCNQGFMVERILEQGQNITVVYFDKKPLNPHPAPATSAMDFKPSLKTIWWTLAPASVKLFFGFKRDSKRLSTIFKDYRLDILHANEVSPAPEAALCAAKAAGIQCVLGTFHALPKASEQFSWVYSLIKSLTFKNVDAAIFVSRASSEAWAKHTPIAKDKIHVVYNGIILDRYGPIPETEKQCYRDEFNIRPEDIVIGVAARLAKEKGHLDLVSAIGLIAPQLPNLRVLLMGEGDLTEPLKELIKSKNITGHFRFLGFRTDVDKINHILDLAVLPSTARESLPYALIEAMACSKPTVATRVGGVPEVVEEGITGLLVQAGNPKELAAAILAICQDNAKAKQMGERGRKKVEEYFTQERMLKETVDLYQKCLK